jgi:ppGpp synthetase/RelA/SpoT-type nucleotidyltranferase
MGSRKVEFNEAIQKVRDEMAAKKTTTTKRTGTKATKTRTAGKTVRAAEAFKVPRTAKQLAAAIQQRLEQSPNFWAELAHIMADATRPQAPTRVTQVMPRTSTPEAAHH